MMRMTMAAATALSLAACGGGAEQAATTNNGSAATTQDYAAQIRALPQGQRDGVLLRAIRDAGQDCQQVTESSPVEDSGGTAWAAVCDGRAAWLVALNPGGVATVTPATPNR